MIDQEGYFKAIEKLLETLTPDEQKAVKQTVMKKNKGKLSEILRGLLNYITDSALDARGHHDETQKKIRYNKVCEFLLNEGFVQVRNIILG